VPRFEYVFIHREAAPLGPPVFEWIIAKVFRKKIIFDFDDAIWIPNTTAENKAASFLKAPWKVAKICKWAYRISAGNQYLADFAKQYNDDVVVLPTCVDMSLGHNLTKEHREQKPVVGWTGSHSTLPYLDEVVPVIRELQRRYAFTFMVIANKDPELTLPDYRFVQWNEATEAMDLLQLDIGIMPLTEDRWSEGKCGFKLIQYLALGIPAIASPVGVNKVIIEDGVNGFLVSDAATWTQKLEILLNNSTLRKQMGEEGRQLIAARYSIQANLRQFLKLFS
jgi:glycosyltransferase involved in cell wall biosynthesis